MQKKNNSPARESLEQNLEAISDNSDGLTRRSFVGVLAAGAAAGMGILATSCSSTTSAATEKKATEPVPEPVVMDAKYTIVDNHVHLMDFLQKTDGVEALVEKMDEAGVSQAVLFGMAMAKQWDEDSDNQPSYYLSNDSRTYYYSATDYLMMERLQAASPEHRARFLPFVCGINPNDRFAAEHIRQALDLYPNQFAGIGELMSRHDDLTALTYGEPPHLDHPAFLEVFDLAAEEGLPVLIHHNISGSYMDDPIYLEELKAGLAHNRETKIIWAHVGISRRIEISNLIEITDSLLKENANLWIDLSWVVFDDYISKDMNAWAELIESHPDRFMIGSDCVGHWEKYAPTIQRYYDLVDLLSPEAATKLCYENILSIVKRYQ
ncbi:MAG: amidohydrolase family protein [Raoultibacter sp.]